MAWKERTATCDVCKKPFVTTHPHKKRCSPACQAAHQNANLWRQYGPRPAPAGVVVRCLGPGEEHTFLSDDPKCHRVCDACGRLIEARCRSLSPMALRPGADVPAGVE